MGFENCLNCGKDISDIPPGTGGKISGTSGDYCNEACWEGHIQRASTKSLCPRRRTSPISRRLCQRGVCPRFAAAQYAKWQMHNLQKEFDLIAADLRESCHVIEVEAMAHYYHPEDDPEAEVISAVAGEAIRNWQAAFLQLTETIGRAQITFEQARVQIAMNVDVSRVLAPSSPRAELLTAAQRSALGGLSGPEGGGSES